MTPITTWVPAVAVVLVLIVASVLSRWAYIQMRSLGLRPNRQRPGFLDRDGWWRLDRVPQDLWARWQERGRREVHEARMRAYQERVAARDAERAAARDAERAAARAAAAVAAPGSTTVPRPAPPIDALPPGLFRNAPEYPAELPATPVDPPQGSTQQRGLPERLSTAELPAMPVDPRQASTAQGGLPGRLSPAELAALEDAARVNIGDGTERHEEEDANSMDTQIHRPVQDEAEREADGALITDGFGLGGRGRNEMEGGRW